jgi:hypothetical protein
MIILKWILKNRILIGIILLGYNPAADFSEHGVELPCCIKGGETYETSEQPSAFQERLAFAE